MAVGREPGQAGHIAAAVPGLPVAVCAAHPGGGDAVGAAAHDDAADRGPAAANAAADVPIHAADDAVVRRVVLGRAGAVLGNAKRDRDHSAVLLHGAGSARAAGVAPDGSGAYEGDRGGAGGSVPADEWRCCRREAHTWQTLGVAVNAVRSRSARGRWTTQSPRR